MPFTPLKSMLPSSLNRTGVKDAVEATMVLERFLQIVKREFGEQIVTRVKPLFVKNGTLTVSCLSSVVASDLKLREKKILGALQRANLEPAVQRLRFFL